MNKLFVLTCFGLIAFAAATSLDDMVLDNELINQINSENSGWTAGRNERFEGVTVREARAMLGALPSAVHLPASSEVALNAPENFDSREQWPDCVEVIAGIRDQGRCGSCWAFAAAELLTDRVCIKSGGKVNVVLSPQDMVSCDKGNYGCQGGYLDVSMNYLARDGIVTEECFPYVSGQSGKVPKCPKEKCTGKGEWEKTKGDNPRDCSGVDRMIGDLVENGPFEIGFTVYRDFMAYKSGVYSHKSKDVLGGHAVEIIGYGVEGGEDYWLVANSWGSSWGDNGYFKILRGVNECGLERQAVAVSAMDSVSPPAVYELFKTL